MRTASFFAVYTATVAGIARVRNDARPNLVRLVCYLIAHATTLTLPLQMPACIWLSLCLTGALAGCRHRHWLRHGP